jgi:general L-amino acid transport system permease protein
MEQGWLAIRHPDSLITALHDRAMNWNSRRSRGLIYQALLVGMLLCMLAWLLTNTLSNMQARGIRSGFDFLGDNAGFDIGESLLAYDASQPYWKAFVVGLLNTLRVSLLGMVGCTLLGTLIGVGRVSHNALARGLCYAYTELFRNIPLLLQLFMWYVLLVEWMPESETPLHWADLAFLSKSGLTLPWLTSADGVWRWDVPVWQNGNVTGGASLSPEFVALTWGLTLYTAAFVAEVVRAGLLSVPRGQIEAAHSIGLSPALTLRLVVLPQAMRLIVPPMTNQYLNLIKNSSLAVAIGYPDLVNISNTALNQTGRAVECIALVMAVYLTLSLLTAAAMNAYNRRVATRIR